MTFDQGTLTDTFEPESRSALSEGDRYLAFLGFVLLGYAVLGKGFAYIGIPPLYIGEIAFFTGIFVFLRMGTFLGVFTTLPALLLTAMMAWVLVRTFPFLGLYGVDALRDSTIVMYGGFAFIVIGLLLEDARRIHTVLRYYRTMLTAFPALLMGFVLTKYWGYDIPQMWGPVPIVDITASANGTHLAGAMVFVLIGYRKVSVPWVLFWLATLASVSATNRGAMLAAIVPVMIAMLVLDRYVLMLKTAVVTVGILAALFAIESAFGDFTEAKDSNDRPVSAHQLVENFQSIVGQSGQQTDGTKQWRLNWWNIIINDTIHGPNFWTGRGFGINIAEADGFGETGEARVSRPLTRSPHNAQMTVLARSGVPGLVLWLIMLASWFGMMISAMVAAHARGHKEWLELFLFTLCYAMAILINASVDVVLEGPMQGIWFWCLFGFGVGSVMVYRAQYSHGVGAR